jgi:hypothetical protein
MPGIAQRTLLEIALDQHGYVTSSDARDAGIDPRRLVDLEANGQATREAHGIYRLTQIPYDEYDQYMFATLWPRGAGVISHESAAVLHQLGNVNPAQVDVTVPRAMRFGKRPPAFLQLHRENLDEDSIVRVEGVRVVSPFRAAFEMITGQSRRELTRQVVEEARAAALITRDQRDHLMGLIVAGATNA